MLKTFFQPLIAWYLAALKTGGYPAIVLLMTMESSFLPLPSEVIIPPAAHLADAGQIPAGIRGHCPRRRVWFVARRDPDVLAGADGRASAGFALWKIRFVPAGKTGEG